MQIGTNFIEQWWNLNPQPPSAGCLTQGKWLFISEPKRLPINEKKEKKNPEIGTSEWEQERSVWVDCGGRERHTPLSGLCPSTCFCKESGRTQVDMPRGWGLSMRSGPGDSLPKWSQCPGLSRAQARSLTNFFFILKDIYLSIYHLFERQNYGKGRGDRERDSLPLIDSLPGTAVARTGAGQRHKPRTSCRSPTGVPGPQAILYRSSRLHVNVRLDQIWRSSVIKRLSRCWLYPLHHNAGPSFLDYCYRCLYI